MKKRLGSDVLQKGLLWDEESKESTGGVESMAPWLGGHRDYIRDFPKENRGTPIDAWEKNGKRGMLGHPSVHCWLLCFLCYGSMFHPYL